MDALMLCIVAALPVLVGLLLPGQGLGRALRNRLTTGWLTLWTCILIFMELSTPSFISEYDTRPNRLFIEHLDHPKEVVLTLFSEYRLAVILSVVLTSLVIWLGARLFSRLCSQAHPWPLRKRLAVLPLYCCFSSPAPAPALITARPTPAPPPSPAIIW